MSRLKQLTRMCFGRRSLPGLASLHYVFLALLGWVAALAVQGHISPIHASSLPMSQTLNQAVSQAETEATEAMSPAQQARDYVKQGRYGDAIAPYRQAIQQVEQAGAGAQLLPLLGNLAIAYRITGQYLLAIETNQRLIDLLQQQDVAATPEVNQRSLTQQSRALGNLGNVYSDLGLYEQAQASYEQALELAEQLSDESGQAIIWNSLGALAARQNKPSVALKAYDRSLTLATAANNPLAQGNTWLNQGDTLHSKGQFGPAITNYQKSLAVAKSSQNPRLEAEALGSLGVAQGSRREFATAIDYLTQSLAVSERMGDRPLSALTLNNLGHAHYGARQYDQAEASLRRALELLDELRQGLSDLEKVSIFDTQTKTYNLLQQVLSSQGRSSEALTVSEWGRARAFADLLSQRLGDSRLGDAEIQTAIAPPKLEELQQIARDRQATLVEYSLVPEDDFLHQGKQMGIPEAIFIWVIQPDGQVHQRRADLKPLIAQKQPLEILVRASRCFDSALVCRRQLKRQITQQGGGRRGFGFQDKNLDELVQDPTELSSTPGALSRKTYPGLQQLHKLLIEPIADLLPPDPEQPVIVIPQSELFLVPFPALQTAEGEFLIERHTLLTAPSIQTLELTQRAKAQMPWQTQADQSHHSLAKPEEILVVGNPTMPSIQVLPDQPPQPLAPLPGAEAEAIAIAKVLQAEPLIGDQAKESEVLKRLPQSRWVHLATHGLLSFGVSRPGARSLSPQVPGAIALAVDDADRPSSTSNALEHRNIPDSHPILDGLLTSAEIINLRLNSELVVLSACDTGRGDLTGDGVVGLARAWMGAGVPSVVVSLWPVADQSTATLMQSFYGHLTAADPLSKAQALRQAMLTNARLYPNPSDWAAFTLLGEAD